jgi:hypothetical protein
MDFSDIPYINFTHIVEVQYGRPYTNLLGTHYFLPYWSTINHKCMIMVLQCCGHAVVSISIFSNHNSLFVSSFNLSNVRTAGASTPTDSNLLTAEL